MDEDSGRRMREAARRAGVSMSARLVRVVQERTREAWPDDVRALPGAWPDLSTRESLASDTPADGPRESL